MRGRDLMEGGHRGEGDIPRYVAAVHFLYGSSILTSVTRIFPATLHVSCHLRVPSSQSSHFPLFLSYNISLTSEWISPFPTPLEYLECHLDAISLCLV